MSSDRCSRLSSRPWSSCSLCRICLALVYLQLLYLHRLPLVLLSQGCLQVSLSLKVVMKGIGGIKVLEPADPASRRRTCAREFATTWSVSLASILFFFLKGGERTMCSIN